ncbi:MAG: RsmE family RNA methyltransferase [Armatimonadota bacterium]
MSAPSDELRAPVCSPHPLAVGSSVVLTGAELEKLRFREVRGGESFTITDTSGAFYRARVTAFQADAALCTVFERMPMPPEPPIEIILIQAIPSRERMFWIVEKATELGASTIIPVFSSRSVSPSEVSKEKPHRWPAAALRAVRQCRRAVVPLVAEPTLLPQAIAHPTWTRADMRWLLCGPGWPPPPHPPSQPTSTILVVGPEGGWTPEEEGLLCASGAVRVSLTGRILRTETAAVVGITAVLALCGDLFGYRLPSLHSL